MAPDPSKRPAAIALVHCPCMALVDFSVPCDELLVAEMLPPSPRFTRSDSFCPMSSGAPSVGGNLSSCPGSVMGGGEVDSKQCSTPSGAAYRHFVTSPPNVGHLQQHAGSGHPQRQSPSLPHNFLAQAATSPRAGLFDDSAAPAGTAGFHMALRQAQRPDQLAFSVSPRSSPRPGAGAGRAMLTAGAGPSSRLRTESPFPSGAFPRVPPTPSTALKSKTPSSP